MLDREVTGFDKQLENFAMPFHVYGTVPYVKVCFASFYAYANACDFARLSGNRWGWNSNYAI